MNARQHLFELTADLEQVSEVVSCFLHTLLLHRCTGKLQYRDETNYYIGVLGTEDVDCTTVDHTYLRVSSPSLRRLVDERAAAFHRAVHLAATGVGVGVGAGASARQQPGAADVNDDDDRNLSSSSFHHRQRPPLSAAVPVQAAVQLEFVERKPAQWRFLPDDCAAWEQWRLCVDVHRFTDRHQWSTASAHLSTSLRELALRVCALVNRPQYVPKMPVRQRLALVFDTRLPDVQPYLFRISEHVPSLAARTGSQANLGSALKHLVKYSWAS